MFIDYYISPSTRTKGPQVEEVQCFVHWYSSGNQKYVWRIVVAKYLLHEWVDQSVYSRHFNRSEPHHI